MDTIAALPTMGHGAPCFKFIRAYILVLPDQFCYLETADHAWQGRLFWDMRSPSELASCCTCHMPAESCLEKRLGGQARDLALVPSSSGFFHSAVPQQCLPMMQRPMPSYKAGIVQLGGYSLEDESKIFGVEATDRVSSSVAPQHVTEHCNQRHA